MKYKKFKCYGCFYFPLGVVYQFGNDDYTIEFLCHYN